MVPHYKQSCSCTTTTATRYGTRPQASLVVEPQLQLPAVATGSYSKGLQLPSLPLPPSPVIPRRISRAQRGGMQCGTARGAVGINPNECRQTPRFASTTRGRHIRDSTQLRQRRSGFTDTAGVTRGRRHHEDGIGTRRVILPLGACRSSRYIPIGNAHLGRRSRYQPLPVTGPRS